ncbi:MAG: hypothetical protein ACLFVO_17700 [Chloroflexaceae bacterium]
MIKMLQRLNITSDMAYLAVIMSILLSIVAWFTRRGDDPQQAERFGIFVGLWAPTFGILGRALQEEERKFKLES